MSAQGLSVALPLRIDARDGAYGLNKNLLQVAEQNLKMIILKQIALSFSLLQLILRETILRGLENFYLISAMILLD